MVREEKPLEHFRNLLDDVQTGRYGYYEEHPERKDEAEKIYKQVIRVLEAEQESHAE